MPARWSLRCLTLGECVEGPSSFLTSVCRTQAPGAAIDGLQSLQTGTFPWSQGLLEEIRDSLRDVLAIGVAARRVPLVG